MITETVEQSRWYPSPPPALDGETDDAYTDRLTGADRTGRVPYDHRRNRQCSIGWHRECTDPAGEACKCPCHTDSLPMPLAVQDAVLIAGARRLADLYDLPEVTGHRVMLIAREQAERRRGLPDATLRGGIAVALAEAYRSRTGSGFLEDVVGVYRAAEAGKL
jgi:hypothetical protein